MQWNNQTKEIFAHVCAGVLLIFGMFILGWGFLTPPVGEVHDSLLWIFGQTLVFSGAVLGISLHVDNSVKMIEAKLEKKLHKQLHDELTEEMKDDNQGENQE